MLTFLQICITALCCFGLMYLVVWAGYKIPTKKPTEETLEQAATRAVEAWLKLNKLQRQEFLSNDPIPLRYEIRKAQTEYAFAMATLCRMCGMARHL